MDIMEINEYITGLKGMLDNSSSKYLEIAEASDILIRSGFKKLSLDSQFPELHPGDKVFVTKNGSSLFAFIIGENLPSNGMKVISAHSDFPCLQIKTNPEIMVGSELIKLNVEPYGGPLLSTWFDRPLSIAGRVFIKGPDPYDCVAYVYTGLAALTASKAQKHTLSLAVWDNEECGSISKQGAASVIYRDVLERIIEAAGYKTSQTSQFNV